MKVEYSRRAISDLHEISAYYKAHADVRVAAAIADRIEAVVTRVSKAPESAQRVAERQSIRVVPLRRYPYKIFYRVGVDRITVRTSGIHREATGKHQDKGARPMAMRADDGVRGSTPSRNDRDITVSQTRLFPQHCGPSRPAYGVLRGSKQFRRRVRVQ